MKTQQKKFTPPIFETLTLLLMSNFFITSSFAQNLEQEKPRFKVEVDSQIIKATPYEITFDRGKEIHHDENVEWYTDAQVYRFIPKQLNENGAVMEKQTLSPAIFLLSGGAFRQKDNLEELNPANTQLHNNLKLATKLANDGNVVIWINYAVETNLFYSTKILSLLTESTSAVMNGSEAKARLEHASLKSFRDFRVKLKQEITKTTNYIDPNNVFVAGISSGAFLTIYSVFLDKSEIPSNITYVANGSTSTTTVITIGPTNALRTNGYPMPPIKGIIPMAGGSLYNNIFSNNTSYTNTVAVNFMHGTCDEVVNQNVERVSYKFGVDIFASPVVFYYNILDANRYPQAYGSKHLYNLLLANHNKIGFGQIINGGHNIIGIKNNVNYSENGAWDVMETTYGNPPPIPNMSLPINQRDIVFENISNFMKSVMGKPGYPVWTNHAYSVFPDMPTTGCLTDDLSLINSPITAQDIICGAESATINPNLSLGATVTWSVSPNLQIIGSNTGATINYNSNGATSGTGVITVDVTNNGYTISVNKTINISTTSFPTPIPDASSSGYDLICSGSKTLTLTNLPTSYTSITWSKIGGLTIVSQIGASVTYQRSGPAPGGILTATIVTPCETKSFNFNITSYRTLNFSPDNIMAMNGECGAIIFSNSEPPIKMRNNSIATFAITYTNANLSGITGADWQFTCGTIISGPSNYWMGNDLKSIVTVQVSSSSSSSCGDIRVRPTNPCSIGTYWRTQDTEFGTCGGGWSLLTYPNPSTSFLEITLKNEEKKANQEKLYMEVLDIMGNVILKSYIEDGRKQINTSNMQPGKYQIVIYTNEEILNTSFIVKK